MPLTSDADAARERQNQIDEDKRTAAAAAWLMAAVILGCITLVVLSIIFFGKGVIAGL